MRKIKVLSALLAAGFLFLFAGFGAVFAAEGENVHKYVASTAWTGAIAEAAGARSVAVLAPLDLKHPPEYDFRPSDAAKVLDADVIFWGGYEGFVRKLVEANDVPPERLYRIVTNNAPQNLKEQTRAIARHIGTESEQQAWEARFDALWEGIIAEAQRREVANIKVVVNFHQEQFVRSLGYNVVGVFGQDELTPRTIADLLAANPDMVIDNWHNAMGKPIAEGAGAEYVELLNFPGTHGTRTIESLIEYNVRQLGLLP